ncbi:MAG: ATP-binding protein, partial [Candidatus Microsaccharimonas sp.]
MTVLPKLDPGTYIVAVSGGVDSVVLLDMLARASSRLPSPGPQYIVAHFDHGIRDDSRDDAQFVKHLAETYGLVYESERVELGVGASEELARTKRYEFLRGVA